MSVCLSVCLSSGISWRLLKTVCKLFGPRSVPTKSRAWSGYKLSDTDGIFFLKTDFEKYQQTTKETCEITQHANSSCIGFRRAAIFLSYLPCKHTQSIMTHAVVGRGGIQFKDF